MKPRPRDPEKLQKCHEMASVCPICRFIVPGEPFGQPRHRTRGARWTRAGFMQHPDPRGVAYQARVAGHWLAAMGGRFGGRLAVHLGSVGLLVTAFYPVPKAMPAWRRYLADTGSAAERPHGKPDWDNVGKIVADALNGRAYRDDAQIVDGRVLKRWALDGRPRIEVELILYPAAERPRGPLKRKG